MEHSAELLTCITLSRGFKTFVLSIIEWPLNPFTALPRVTLGVNTASYTPVPQVWFGLNMGLTWCCLYACNIQGTELNYPYLLYNERVNFFKIYIIPPRPKACFSQGKRPF